MEKFIFDLWAFGISGSFSVPLCLRGGFCFPMTAMSRDHGDGGDFLPLYYPCAISPLLGDILWKSFFRACTRYPDHRMKHGQQELKANS